MNKLTLGLLFLPLGSAFVIPGRVLRRGPSLVRYRAAATAEAAPLVGSAESAVGSAPEVRYDHLQVFVDKLQPLAHYKLVEKKLNWFAAAAAAEGLPVDGSVPRQVDKLRSLWLALNYNAAEDPAAFVGHGQDLVEQLQVGMGWRVTAALDDLSTTIGATSSSNNPGAHCRSMLLSSAAGGVGLQVVVTEVAPVSTAAATTQSSSHGMLPLSAASAVRFKASHGGAQGIGVLGFSVAWGQLDNLAARYDAKHPNLVLAAPSPGDGDGCRVLEVCAYYAAAANGSAEVLEPTGDAGTVLRFVERRPRTDADGPGTARATYKVLPGLTEVAADFDGTTSSGCFADHWVSNVVDRGGFMATLEDCLGFTPKVDFNAGVVAAGEAQIESTVTGNAGGAATRDPLAALADNRQVFLPINNALSPVGHVHGYLEELGQGIQHVASRVADLPTVVQRANDYRKITGLGLAFLNIPRTYYGLLDAQLLDQCLATAYAQELPSAPGSGGSGSAAGAGLGAALLAALRAAGAVDGSGAAELGLVASLVAAEADETEDEQAVREAKEAAAAADAATDADASGRFDPLAALGAAPKPPEGAEGCAALELALASMTAPGRAVPEPVRRGVSAALRFSAYRNLHALLGDRLNETAYLSIVRNQILVDVQGGDVLMQIFTQCVLQRQPGQEAPFLEFIQRLCHAPTSSSGDGGGGGDVSNSGSGDSSALIRPGCGGFGIRNFLTLFLSIEASKAMQDQADALQGGHAAAAAFHATRVALFTQQLVEANPLLTAITAAMAAEGAALVAGDAVRSAEATACKAAANEALQANSAKHRDLMKAHRESMAFE